MHWMRLFAATALVLHGWGKCESRSRYRPSLGHDLEPAYLVGGGQKLNGNSPGQGPRPRRGPAQDIRAPAQSENVTCGPAFNNQTCFDGLCCSPAGLCGLGKDYCASPKCLEHFGQCDSDIVPAGSSTLYDVRDLSGSISYDDDIIHCTSINTIALTFDDGPWEYTARLLDLLDRFDAKATFFITGNNIGKGAIEVTPPYPSIIKRMVADGHQVASHTWSHYALSSLSSANRVDQMVKNERAIANIIGKYPTYMRPPYADCTASSGCQSDMKALGYHRILFDLDTEDYKNSNASQVQISKDFVDRHIDSFGWPGNTLSIQHDVIGDSVWNLTEHILHKITGRGWRAVTVGECLGEAESLWYRKPQSAEPEDVPENSCTAPAIQFCGYVEAFENKRECFTSTAHCVTESKDCASPSEVSDLLPEPWDACKQFEAMCEMALLFCADCGWKDAPACEIGAFCPNSTGVQIHRQ